jgi:hypothetical protein
MRLTADCDMPATSAIDRVDQTFDVVTCLFGSLAYLKTLDNLANAVNCMTAHLASGGMLLVEPWYLPASWKPRTVHSIFIDKPDLKIARICSCSADARLSILDVHCLIGTPEHALVRRR